MMPDTKIDEPKNEDVSATAAQTAPKPAKRVAKAKTPKPHVASTPRKKPTESKGAPTSVAKIAAPAASRPTRKTHTADERVKKLGEIQKLVSAGSSVSAATKKLGISEQTYYQWKKPAERKTQQSDDLKDLVKLEAENTRLKKILAERLRKENADLKKKLGLS